MRRGIVALAMAAALTLAGCSGGKTQDNIIKGDSGQEAVEDTEKAELTDKEIADIASDYIGSRDVKEMRELNNTIYPIVESLLDGTFSGDSSELDGAIDICNSVIDMNGVPDCISELHDDCVETARNYRSAIYSLMNACSKYKMGSSDYSDDVDEFLSYYDDVQDTLEDVLDEYRDIVRRSEE